MNNLKYNTIMIGCQMNQSDLERISGSLEDLGFTSHNDKYTANVVVVSTCGVKQSAEEKIYGIIPRIKKHSPETLIILTGCLSKRLDVQKKLNKHVDIWLPTSEITNLKPLLESKLGKIQPNENSPKIGSLKSYLSLHPKYTSSFSAFVPIGNGCDNWCTYCVVPRSRGKEIYRDPEEIINEIKSLIQKGYKEITIIAQNVNSYNTIDQTTQKKTNFAQLLKTLEELEGDFWLRFSTSHPKDMSDELIEVIKNGTKICNHIHLPVQAGNDQVLKKMNRKYSSNDYLILINKIKNNLNKILPVSITTDIIVGFPTETKEQFKETAELMTLVKFDMAYVSRYSPRPDTASYYLKDDVSHEEKKEREIELINIVRSTALENNQAYIGKVIKVIIFDTRDNLIIGRTETAKNVRVSIPNDKIKEDYIGQFATIKITNAQDFGFMGELL